MEIKQQETKQRKSWGQQSFRHEMKWASKMEGGGGDYTTSMKQHIGDPIAPRNKKGWPLILSS